MIRPKLAHSSLLTCTLTSTDVLWSEHLLPARDRCFSAVQPTFLQHFFGISSRFLRHFGVSATCWTEISATCVGRSARRWLTVISGLERVCLSR